MQPGGSGPSAPPADGVPAPRGLLGAAMAAEPPLLDAQDRTPAHGEKIKRGPAAEPHDPNVDYEDVTTADVRTASLVDDVQRDKPLLDEQQGVPPHTTDKEGVHDLTQVMQQGQQQQGQQGQQ